jgi:hypothetical protein
MIEQLAKNHFFAPIIGKCSMRRRRGRKPQAISRPTISHRPTDSTYLVLREANKNQSRIKSLARCLRKFQGKAIYILFSDY